MPRTGKVKKRVILKDPIYQSFLVNRLINKIMISGKKTIAQKQVYKALESLVDKKDGIKDKDDPLEILDKALDNIKPKMEVRGRRIGGASYQVPIPVRSDRRESLALRWLILAAQSKPNKEYHHFWQKLASEIKDAYNNTGSAVKKKEDIHRMADANKAFAHFRW